MAQCSWHITLTLTHGDIIDHRAGAASTGFALSSRCQPLGTLPPRGPIPMSSQRAPIPLHVSQALCIPEQTSRSSGVSLTGSVQHLRTIRPCFIVRWINKLDYEEQVLLPDSCLTQPTRPAWPVLSQAAGTPCPQRAWRHGGPGGVLRSRHPLSAAGQLSARSPCFLPDA